MRNTLKPKTAKSDSDMRQPVGIIENMQVQHAWRAISRISCLASGDRKPDGTDSHSRRTGKKRENSFLKKLRVKRLLG